MNSIAGSLGLFLGITAFSMIEIVELAFDYIIVCCYKLALKSKGASLNNNINTSRDVHQNDGPHNDNSSSNCFNRRADMTEQSNTSYLNASNNVSSDDMEVQNIEETNHPKHLSKE